MKITLIFILLSSIITSAQNKQGDLFVYIDSTKDSELYVFEKKVNNKFSSIKILKFDRKNKSGFTQEKRKHKDGNSIVVVNSQPISKNYYEFRSYKKPKEINSIDSLNFFYIKDLSKNIDAVSYIWKDSKYSIHFVEKINCKTYKVWEMSPVFRE